MLKNLRRQLEPTLERSTVDTSPSELAPAAAECTVHYHYVLLSRRPVFLHHLIGITHDTKASTRTRSIRSSPSYVRSTVKIQLLYVCCATARWIAPQLSLATPATLPLVEFCSNNK